MFLLLLEFLILSIELLLYSRQKNTLNVYNPALVEFQALDIPSRVHVQCQRGERLTEIKGADNYALCSPLRRF